MNENLPPVRAGGVFLVVGVVVDVVIVVVEAGASTLTSQT